MNRDRCILDVTMKEFLRTAGSAGALIYEYLRREVLGDGLLSMERLGTSLERCRTPLGEQAEGEVVIGCMFAAVLAIEEVAPRTCSRRDPQWSGQRIHQAPAGAGCGW